MGEWPDDAFRLERFVPRTIGRTEPDAPRRPLRQGCP